MLNITIYKKAQSEQGFTSRLFLETRKNNRDYTAKLGHTLYYTKLKT